jgi:hypothetical protein
VKESFLLEVFGTGFVQWEQTDEDRVAAFVSAATQAWSRLRDKAFDSTSSLESSAAANT